MCGLILKDIYVFKSSWKATIGTAIFITWAWLLAGKAYTAIFYVIVFYATQFVTFFSCDKESGFDSYALTLCITRRDIVNSRYVLAIVTIIFSISLVILSGFVLFLFGSPVTDVLEAFPSVTGAVSCGLVIYAVSLSSIYSYGYENGRTFMTVALFFIFGFLLLLLQADAITDEQTMIFFGATITKIAVLLFVLSYFISQRMYAKREF